MREIILISLIKWLAGITADQWENALHYTIRAARFYKKDEDKDKYWREYMGPLLADRKPRVGNFLRELALAFAHKKGLI